MDRQLVGISKFLSFVLRHKPEAIGIALDAAGWVAVDELLAGAASHGLAELHSTQVLADVADQELARTDVRIKVYPA